MVLAIGFYAVKGGLFTIATLGQFRVWGPEDSFIYDNNAFALATVMSIPLWVYLFTQSAHRPWVRFGIMFAVAMSAVSAIGTHSRGAVLAIVAMAMFLWFKSRRKLVVGLDAPDCSRRNCRLHAERVGGSRCDHHQSSGGGFGQQST